MNTLITKYHDHLKHHAGVADSTAGLYLRVISQFEHFLSNRPPGLRKDLLEAGSSDIASYFAYLYENNLTQNTRRTYVKFGLKGFYEYLYYHKLIPERIDFKYANTKRTFKESKVRKQYLKIHHMEQIREYLRNNQPVAGSPADYYYHLELITEVELLFETGCRRSELIAMKYKDVGENYISIFTAKTARRINNHYRSVPVSQNLIEQLNATRELYVLTFGREPDRIITRYKDMHISAVSRNITNLGKLVGLDLLLHPHLFRHYRITYFVHLRNNQGSLVFILSEVAQIMGASIKTILAYYDHPDNEEVINAYHKQNIL